MKKLDKQAQEKVLDNPGHLEASQSASQATTQDANVREDAEGYLHPTEEPGDYPEIGGEFNHSGLAPDSYRTRPGKRT